MPVQDDGKTWYHLGRAYNLIMADLQNKEAKLNAFNQAEAAL